MGLQRRVFVLKRVILTGVAVCGLAMVLAQPCKAEDPRSIRGVIAEHCTDCHKIPGFMEEARTPAISAPDFQAIADDPKTYTRLRLEAFLRQPHFPMRQFTLSATDIQNIIAFIEGLRVRPEHP